MGDDGFLRFGLFGFYSAMVTVVEVQEASIFVNFCFDACGG